VAQGNRLPKNLKLKPAINDLEDNQVDAILRRRRIANVHNEFDQFRPADFLTLEIAIDLTRALESGRIDRRRRQQPRDRCDCNIRDQSGPQQASQNARPR
jgi:hypothetical protein